MQKSPAPERRARWAVAVIFLANGSIIGTWAAHIPLVEQRLAISHATLGLALLAVALGALVAMPLGGAAIARLGSAAVTRGSTIAWIASFPLPILAPDPLLLMAALFVFGAANGVMDVAMNAHGVAVERELGRPVMSSFHGMFSLGGLAGAGIAAALLPFVPALAEALLMTTLVGLASVAALFFLLPSAADQGGSGTAFALPGKATLGLGALCFLAMLTEGAILDWSALHLAESFPPSAGMAAAGFAAFSATMAAGRFAGDWLRGHFGAIMLVRTSAFLAAIGLAVALASPVFALAVGSFAIVGLGIANLVPIFFGAAGRLPGQAGSAIAAVATMGYAGFLCGPPVIGFVAQASSLAAALGLMVLALAVIGIGAIAVEPAKRDAALAPG